MTRKTFEYFDEDVKYILKLKKAKVIITETDAYRQGMHEYVMKLKEIHGENPKKKNCDK